MGSLLLAAGRYLSGWVMLDIRNRNDTNQKLTFSKIGEPGKRYALPNSSIMIHQPSGGASGQASDIAIHAREILRVRERLNRIFQKHTGIRDLDAIGKCTLVWDVNEY